MHPWNELQINFLLPVDIAVQLNIITIITTYFMDYLSGWLSL